MVARPAHSATLRRGLLAVIRPESIRAKLNRILVVSLALTLVFLSFLIAQETKVYSAARESTKVVTVVLSVQDAVHELQRERGLTNGLLDGGRQYGEFDLAYYGETGGPAPYFELRQWLYTANSAPIGQQAASNFERYRDAQTDALIDQYGATTDQRTQREIVGKLEDIMLQQVPVIPVTESVDWYQYDTSQFTGWVTQEDQYALPSAFQYPDMGQVLLHLQPK